MKRCSAARGFAAGLVVAATTLWSSPALAANCSRTTTGLVPIPDLAGGTYQGERGGLYPAGTNEPPAMYAAAGDRAAQAIIPRDAEGRPSANGKIVLMSVGMSNATQEFSTFVPLSQRDSVKDPHVVVIDGAQGGQDAAAWVSSDAQTWSVLEQRLRQAGLSAAQVQAMWIKEEQAGPRQDFQTHIHSLADQLRQIIGVASARYPNLRQVYLSPRTYGGYATTTLNPEPYAYWSGFADKLVIGDSVARPDARPWVGWGPYLWTDGTKGRRDGFVWTCQDVRESDGTHPSDQGKMKIANTLQQFFDGSPFATWYRMAPPLASSPRAEDATPTPAAETPPPTSEQDQGTRDWRLALAIVGGLAVVGGVGFLARMLRR